MKIREEICMSRGATGQRVLVRDKELASNQYMSCNHLRDKTASLQFQVLNNLHSPKYYFAGSLVRSLLRSS